jgi:hypothetical protein
MTTTTEQQPNGQLQPNQVDVGKLMQNIDRRRRKAEVDAAVVDWAALAKEQIDAGLQVSFTQHPILVQEEVPEKDGEGKDVKAKRTMMKGFRLVMTVLAPGMSP